MSKYELITKFDAIKRQLDTAIELFMDDKDLLSVNTLVVAALKVIFDYYKKEKIPNKFLDLIKPERKKDYMNMLTKTYNYSRHADSDHEKTNKFYYESVQGLLLEAVELFSDLTKPSLLMVTYKQWFLFNNPDLMLETEETGKLKDEIKKFDFSDKKEFKRMELDILQKRGYK